MDASGSTAQKVAFQLSVYPEAGHGFFCDEREATMRPRRMTPGKRLKTFSRSI